MSTLSEVETVIDRLSLEEQEQLLRHLESTLRRKPNATAAESRADWMRRLNTLRRAIGSGSQTLSGEQILDELRED